MDPCLWRAGQKSDIAINGLSIFFVFHAARHEGTLTSWKGNNGRQDFLCLTCLGLWIFKLFWLSSAKKNLIYCSETQNTYSYVVKAGKFVCLRFKKTASEQKNKDNRVICTDETNLLLFGRQNTETALTYCEARRQKVNALGSQVRPGARFDLDVPAAWPGVCICLHHICQTVSSYDRRWLHVLRLEKRRRLTKLILGK